VVVILGLLLGAVLKGQELVTSARIRSLISHQDGVRAAYFGFLDRFRALPGDYSLATSNIAGATVNGDGNHQIQSIVLSGCTPGPGCIDEHIAVWEHLSRAGFINGLYTYNAVPENPASVPTNPYTRYVQVIDDNVYGTGSGAMRHNIKTGNRVPSDILAEIDRKIDDGRPVAGVFQFSTYNGGAGGTAPMGGAAGTCYVGISWTVPSVSNCGGASLL
jgi:hypothetical protein